MFFIRTNLQVERKPCFVLWYKDPVHLQEERRPPSVNALDELRNSGMGTESVETVQMMLVWKEQGNLKVSRGIIQYEYEKLFLDDESGFRNFLDYPESFVPHNKVILSLNEQKDNYFTKFRVPVLSNTEIHFKKVAELGNLSDAWIGALVVSRAKITLFMIWNIIKNYPYTENPFTMEFREHPQRFTESSQMSTNFLLFVPTAKPKSLEEFLQRASGSQISEKESKDMLERSFPLYEGYYRVHVHRMRSNTDENCHYATVQFDDYGGTKEEELWHGRIDFGRRDTTIESVGVPEEKDRGYLSLDMPTLLNSKHSRTSSIGYGDWGFTGCIENTEVFMVPDSTKNEDLFEQNRSKGAMKNITRRILSRNKPIYSSLMLSSVDNKYKLIYDAPDFEDILTCLKHGTAPSSSNNQEEFEYISEEADVQSKKRTRSSASGPKEVTVSGSPDSRTDANDVKSRSGSPPQKKTKCTNEESSVQNTGSTAEHQSSQGEIVESCSPKNPSAAKSQVPEEEQLFESEEDAIAPDLNQASSLKEIETHESSPKTPVIPPEATKQLEITDSLSNLQVADREATKKFPVNLTLPIPMHEESEEQQEYGRNQRNSQQHNPIFLRARESGKVVSQQHVCGCESNLWFIFVPANRMFSWLGSHDRFMTYTRRRARSWKLPEHATAAFQDRPFQETKVQLVQTYIAEQNRILLRKGLSAFESLVRTTIPTMPALPKWEFNSCAVDVTLALVPSLLHRAHHMCLFPSKANGMSAAVDMLATKVLHLLHFCDTPMLSSRVRETCIELARGNGCTMNWTWEAAASQDFLEIHDVLLDLYEQFFKNDGISLLKGIFPARVAESYQHNDIHSWLMSIIPQKKFDRGLYVFELALSTNENRDMDHEKIMNFLDCDWDVGSLADNEDVASKKGSIVGIISLMKPSLVHFTAGLRIDGTFYTYDGMRYGNLLSRSSIRSTFGSSEGHSIDRSLVLYLKG